MAERGYDPEALVRRVLAIEVEARRIVDEARAEAKRIADRAEEEVAGLRRWSERETERSVKDRLAAAKALGEQRTQQILEAARRRAESTARASAARRPEAVAVARARIMALPVPGAERRPT